MIIERSAAIPDFGHFAAAPPVFELSPDAFPPAPEDPEPVALAPLSFGVLEPLAPLFALVDALPLWLVLSVLLAAWLLEPVVSDAVPPEACCLCCNCIR